MAGHAVDLDGVTVRAVDRGDDAGRQALGLEHRALLDVQLGVSEHVFLALCSFADALGVETEAAQRIAHADPAAVDGVQDLRAERARHRAAAEQGGVEPGALLVGEADDLGRERQTPAGGVQRVDALDAGDDAEHPVVLARVTHGVQMRAEDERRQTRPLALVAADAVPRRIEARAHSRLAHPAEHQLVRAPLLVRQVDAGEAPGQLGERRERLAAIPDPLCGRPCRFTHATVSLPDRIRMARKSLTLVRVGPVVTRSPSAAKKP